MHPLPLTAAGLGSDKPPVRIAGQAIALAAPTALISLDFSPAYQCLQMPVLPLCRDRRFAGVEGCGKTSLQFTRRKSRLAHVF